MPKGHTQNPIPSNNLKTLGKHLTLEHFGKRENYNPRGIRQNVIPKGIGTNSIPRFQSPGKRQIRKNNAQGPCSKSNPQQQTENNTETLGVQTILLWVLFTIAVREAALERAVQILAMCTSESLRHWSSRQHVH